MTITSVRIIRQNHKDKGSIIMNLDDGLEINVPNDANNGDYKKYLTWIKEGNKPDIINISDSKKLLPAIKVTSLDDLLNKIKDLEGAIVAMKGFMMMMPDIQKSLREIKEVLASKDK